MTLFNKILLQQFDRLFTQFFSLRRQHLFELEGISTYRYQPGLGVTAVYGFSDRQQGRRRQMMGERRILVRGFYFLKIQVLFDLAGMRVYENRFLIFDNQIRNLG